ncbi:hypothetical protein PLESTM_001192900 [Pleodorina starrii]|nr:hypothetical protein PLESTM_001192900 [Pleodorina starrii]
MVFCLSCFQVKVEKSGDEPATGLKHGRDRTTAPAQCAVDDKEILGRLQLEDARDADVNGSAPLQDGGGEGKSRKKLLLAGASSKDVWVAAAAAAAAQQHRRVMAWPSQDAAGAPGDTAALEALLDDHDNDNDNDNDNDKLDDDYEEEEGESPRRAPPRGLSVYKSAVYDHRSLMSSFIRSSNKVLPMVATTAAAEDGAPADEGPCADAGVYGGSLRNGGSVRNGGGVRNSGAFYGGVGGGAFQNASVRGGVACYRSNSVRNASAFYGRSSGGGGDGGGASVRHASLRHIFSSSGGGDTGSAGGRPQSAIGPTGGGGGGAAAAGGGGSGVGGVGGDAGASTGGGSGVISDGSSQNVVVRKRSETGMGGAVGSETAGDGCGVPPPLPSPPLRLAPIGSTVVDRAAAGGSFLRRRPLGDPLSASLVLVRTSLDQPAPPRSSRSGGGGSGSGGGSGGGGGSGSEIGGADSEGRDAWLRAAPDSRPAVLHHLGERRWQSFSARSGGTISRLGQQPLQLEPIGPLADQHQHQHQHLPGVADVEAVAGAPGGPQPCRQAHGKDNAGAASGSPLNGQRSASPADGGGRGETPSDCGSPYRSTGRAVSFCVLPSARVGSGSGGGGGGGGPSSGGGRAAQPSRLAGGLSIRQLKVSSALGASDVDAVWRSRHPATLLAYGADPGGFGFGGAGAGRGARLAYGSGFAAAPLALAASSPRGGLFARGPARLRGLPAAVHDDGVQSDPEVVGRQRSQRRWQRTRQMQPQRGILKPSAVVDAAAGGGGGSGGAAAAVLQGDENDPDDDDYSDDDDRTDDGDGDGDDESDGDVQYGNACTFVSLESVSASESEAMASAAAARVVQMAAPTVPVVAADAAAAAAAAGGPDSANGAGSPPGGLASCGDLGPGPGPFEPDIVMPRVPAPEPEPPRRALDATSPAAVSAAARAAFAAAAHPTAADTRAAAASFAAAATAPVSAAGTSDPGLRRMPGSSSSDGPGGGATSSSSSAAAAAGEGLSALITVPAAVAAAAAAAAAAAVLGGGGGSGGAGAAPTTAGPVFTVQGDGADAWTVGKHLHDAAGATAAATAVAENSDAAAGTAVAAAAAAAAVRRSMEAVASSLDRWPFLERKIPPKVASFRLVLGQGQGQGQGGPAQNNNSSSGISGGGAVAAAGEGCTALGL